MNRSLLHSPSISIIYPPCDPHAPWSPPHYLWVSEAWLPAPKEVQDQVHSPSSMPASKGSDPLSSQAPHPDFTSASPTRLQNVAWHPLSWVLSHTQDYQTGLWQQPLPCRPTAPTTPRHCLCLNLWFMLMYGKNHHNIVNYPPIKINKIIV